MYQYFTKTILILVDSFRLLGQDIQGLKTSHSGKLCKIKHDIKMRNPAEGQNVIS